MSEAPRFKLYTSLAAERAAAEEDARKRKDDILALKERLWREWCEDPRMSADDIATICEALEVRAKLVEPDVPARGRGNPKVIDTAVYDPLLVAVNVEFLIRQRGLSQTEAAIELSIEPESAGRDPSTLAKLHRCHRIAAAAYLDGIGIKPAK